MALFLIYGKNNTNADPIKQAIGCYSLGDIVEVLDDSKHDGNLVANPIAAPFYLVRITGVTKAQAEKYMLPYLDPNAANAVNVGGVLRYPTLRRRLWNVEVSTLPAGFKAELQANRYAERSWSQVKSYIRNRMTGVTAGVTP